MTLACFCTIISRCNGMPFSAVQGNAIKLSYLPYHVARRPGLVQSVLPRAIFDSAIKTTEVGLRVAERPAAPFCFRVMCASEQPWT